MAHTNRRHCTKRARRLAGAHEASLASSNHDVQTGGGNGGSSSGGTAAIAKSGQDVKVAGGRETVVGDPRVEWWKFADEQQHQDRDLDDKALVADGSRVEVKNSLRLRAEIAQHKEGWCINTEFPVASLGEVLGRPRALVLYLQPKGSTYGDPHQLPWTTTSGGDVQSVVNTAGIRAAADDSTPEELEWMRRDIAQAFARVVRDKYTEIAIPRDLVSACKGNGASRLLSQLIGFKCDQGWGALPKFMGGFDYVELLDEHDRRFRHPKPGQLVYMSAGCGIGGGALAARGVGFGEKKMVLVDSCKEHCEQLRIAFPRALVLCLDLMSEKAKRELAPYKGQVDLLETTANCQPSADMLKKHSKTDKRHGLGRQAVALAALLTPKTFVLEDIVGLRRNQHDEFKKLGLMLEKVFPVVHVVEFNARHVMVGQNRNRLFFVCSDGVSIDSAIRAVWRQKGCHQVGLPTSPTMREMLQPHMDLRGVAAVFIPHLMWAKRGADGRPQRLRNIDTYSTTITSGYGTRGGLSEKAHSRYVECDADFAPKSKSVTLTGQLWGVLNGFPVDTKYSDAQSHDCSTCTTPAGRSRGRVADIERGNVIVPAMALLLYGPLARAASWARSKHGTAAAQVLVSEGMHALKAQALEEFWSGAQQDEAELQDAVVPLLSHTDHDADFEGAVRSFDCKDALAMETEVDDVVMDSGCCETETLLEGGVRLPEPKATLKSGADGGDSCEDEALNGVELGPGAIDDGDDEDIEVRCPDCGTTVNGGTECPICNADGKGGISAQNDGGARHDKKDLEDDVMVKGQTPPGGVRVSDSEAEAFVRIVHQRQGCRPVRLIKEDLRNGNLAGPFITDEQFADLNLSCETCVRALMRRGPVRRRSLRARHVRRRILEEVAVDIVGPRRLPSLRYHTGAGSKFGGGNRYLVLFVDSATQMLFIDFMSEKSQLEAVVRDMRRRMEIEAKGSVEYDGRHPILSLIHI